ncbi:MAG: VWA domain-containing protein [bacterium]|nr:VWA domain-containing protein [bacterium]
MVLNEPLWLLLAIPLIGVMWFWHPPGRLLQTIWVAVAILIVLSACDPGITLPSRSGTLVIVTDRSASMPTRATVDQKEVLNLITSKMPSQSKLAIVSFGQQAVVDRPPRPGAFTQFSSKIDPDGSNLAEALDTAVSLIPTGTPGRILVLSDGRWTGRTPMEAAQRASNSGVSIDYRLMRRPQAGDLAVWSIDAPSSVTPGESYTITAWVRAPTARDITCELRRGEQKLMEGTRSIPSGLSKLTFRDTAGTSGTLRYSLNISGSEKDPSIENNTARFLVGIRGPRPIMCVSASGKSQLVTLLRAGKLDVIERTPDQCTWSLEELSGHSAVIIENVPAQDIGTTGMKMLSAWVSGTSSGFMMTGGKNAYAPGGYFGSPLEQIIPVSMELRREHRKLSLAIVVALDRSGSMSMPVGGGKTKMDLANLAAAQVLDLLTVTDELGVLAVDSSPHLIVPLNSVTNKASIRNRILSIDSMGGGIFVYEALEKAAAMLAKAKAGVRHIILFADADDAEEPGRYKALLAKCKTAGITCSVIGLGTKSGVDAKLLQDVAKRGGGRCFFTDQPNDLPRLFAQDTFVVARSTFLDEVTPINLTGALTAMTGRSFAPPPPVGGYNLCYLRDGASLAGVTKDEYKAPLIAAWQVGDGRALCYTGQADGKYTGPIAWWDHVGHFFTSMARWTAGAETQLPNNMLVTQRVSRGHAIVQLHLDPERKQQPFTSPPSVGVLSGRPGQEPNTHRVTMRWSTPDTLTAEIPIHGSQTVLTTVTAGQAKASMPAVCRPYSPEFRPEPAEVGLKTLQNISSVTAGTQRVELAGIWKDLPELPQIVPLGKWLVLLAMILFALGVLERRTAMLSISASTAGTKLASLTSNLKTRTANTPLPNTSGNVPSSPSREKTKTPKPQATEPTRKTKDTEPSAGSVLDAMTSARRQANQRTKRK